MKNTYTFQLSNDNLGVTPVDNLFINEYMPKARGDYVKIYLYGLKLARCGNTEAIDNTLMAKLFDISELDVVNAWDYWQSEGIIGIRYNDYHQAEIIFYHIPSIMLSGSPKCDQNDEAQNKDLADMYDAIEQLFGSRGIPREGIMTFKRWVIEDGFEPEAVVFLVQYTLDYIENSGKSFTSGQTVKYMNAIAQKWHRAGIHSIENAKEYLETDRMNKKIVYQILKKLGQFRDPMDWERTIIMSWINEYHFDEDLIDLALQRAKKPDVRYVNGILKRWHERHLDTVEAVLAAEKRDPHFYQKMNEVKMSAGRQKEYEDMISEDERWLLEQSNNE